ncbi:TPA: DUF551 domain-containing protein [Klebsiella quasipneumoniae]|nr:DUF551 domain-containing protein [Klebsiella quasipneumoniae]
MTKSTITRERVVALIAEHSYDSALVDALEHLLAAMDSEPVAEVLSNRPGNDTSTIDRALPVGTQLYRHAQPAPVVPEEITSAIEGLKQSLVDCNRYNYCFDAVTRVENACRAAMLQAEPVCTCPSGNGSLRWPCPVHPGNNPEIPDTWIPVSERMPDENAEQQVLACFKGGDISTLYYFEGRWDDAYGIVPIRQDVTHWMPLPAAPQEDINALIPLVSRNEQEGK